LLVTVQEGISGRRISPGREPAIGSWGRPRRVSDSRTSGTFFSRSRAASALPAKWLISACWNSLLAHPAVLDCAVIGLPDDKWGERVTAIIQPYPGQDVTDQDIRAFVKARLGSVKTPKQVEVWTDLPRSKLGKVLKNEVKSQLLSQADHDRR